jgi:predicted membrane GTPase involved in stress response
VTPESIRLRKLILDHNVRKRYEKKPAEVDGD